jgi:hypothetical protein
MSGLTPPQPGESSSPATTAPGGLPSLPSLPTSDHRLTPPVLPTLPALPGLGADGGRLIDPGLMSLLLGGLAGTAPGARP